MSKEEDDSKLPPLQLELDFGEAPLLTVGEITDPQVFEVGIHQAPGHEGIVMLFQDSGYALLFREAAAAKLVKQFDFLIHHALESSHGSSEGGEGASGQKKVTLH